MGCGPHPIRVANRRQGRERRTYIEEIFGSHPVNKKDRGICKKETYLVPAFKDQEPFVAQQGKSNVNAFKHVDCSPGMHNLPVFVGRFVNIPISVVGASVNAAAG
jgi:hypothetical protein